jgi:hypothetical protein
MSTSSATSRSDARIADDGDPRRAARSATLRRDVSFDDVLDEVVSNAQRGRAPSTRDS